MTELALVMPMAGRGSRFRQDGRTTPKPLIELHGRPFFWWAAESVRRATPLRELVFVVLEEHVRDFAIGERIEAVYPEARVIAIPTVTGGAAETAAIGIRSLAEPGPFAVNDCDHAFDARGLERIVRTLDAPHAVAVEGTILGFRADSAAYSYVRLDADGMVAGTVEKQVVSPFAIAGCYLFRHPADFLAALDRCRSEARYAELFVSGMYDQMLRDGARIAFHPLAAHVPFGTPEEMARVTVEQLAALDLRMTAPHAGLFVVAVGVLLLAHALRAVRHSFFFSREELPRRFDLLLALSFSYALNTILPLRVGEVVRTMFIALRVRLRIPYVAATVLAERLSDVIVVAVIVAVLGARSSELARGLPAALGLAVAAGAVIAGAVLVRRSLRARRVIWHVASLFNDAIKVGIVEFAWSTAQLLLEGPYLTVRFLAATTAMWGLYFLAYGLFASATGLSTAQVTLALLGAPLQPLIAELLGGAVSHSSLMVLAFTSIPIVAVMAYGLIRNRQEILRSIALARRFGLRRPDQPLPSVSRRFRNSSDYAVFLLAHFGATNDLVSVFATEGMEDVVVHRFLPGGSDAVTAVVEVRGRLGIRKLAVADAGVKLARQVEWLRDHAGALPLPEVVSEDRRADRYHYDMPFSISARDFYDVIHTAPLAASEQVLREVVDEMSSFHERTCTGRADAARVDAYLDRKVRTNAEEILSYARVAIGERFTINGERHQLSDWSCLLDREWLRAQMPTLDVAGIHGDLTIENIIVCPDRPRGWYLIDPNPDNLFDTPLIDWAKLTQSLNLGYEGLNRGATSTIDGDAIQLVLTKSNAYAQLDRFVSTLLWERIGPEAMREVAFHELVNYLRLTPYKIRRSPQKGLAFFACTAMLLKRYREGTHA